MKRFLGAIQFLTILPVGDHPVEPARLTPFFPLVGLLLGAMVGGFDLIAIHWWPRPVVGVLDVILLLILTGALHMDGLGDTADGLYGQRSREKALAIMKDSRVGAMGAIAMGACILLKAVTIAALPAPRMVFLLVIPAFARSTPMIAMALLPYGRPEGGTGSAFFEKRPRLIDHWGLLLVLALALLTGMRFGALIIAFGGILIVLLSYYRRKMGCITGDMLGALIEVTEAGLLLAATIGES
jgi:adenosylcobinamide-GDP ribazoletransferase